MYSIYFDPVPSPPPSSPASTILTEDPENSLPIRYFENKKNTKRKKRSLLVECLIKANNNKWKN